ncbi:MAG: patatin-like phospholipase family protein [Candidatus Marinimicrobia bacterium]|nr:patatin-like phospholipase family protein [Candidatus Neomarinimicrobiota bacterium]
MYTRHLKIKLLILILFTVSTNSTITANPKITLKKLQDDSLSIGLALSGGAARGLAHIGVIKALEESGIKVDYIAGSSMGALIGAAYASGIPIDTLEKIAINTDWVTVAKLFVPGFSTAGLVDGKRVKEFLGSIYGDVRIEDCPIPFAATAADISTGKLYIINRGSLLEAVRASISIPLVFIPVKYQDILLVDGGLVDPVPIDIVKEMGADYIIAVHVIHGSLASEKGEYIQIENPEPQTSATWKSTSEWLTKQLKIDSNKVKEPKKALIETENNSKTLGIGRISENTLHIAQDVIARLQIELYKPDLVIKPDTRNINLYEFYRGKDAIEIGYNEANKVLMSLPN